MDTFHIALIVLGVLAVVGGGWLLRYFGQLAKSGTTWVQGSLGSNACVFAVLGAWCVGVGLIGYGLGLGAA